MKWFVLMTIGDKRGWSDINFKTKKEATEWAEHFKQTGKERDAQVFSKKQRHEWLMTH